MTAWRLPKLRRIRAEIEPFVEVLTAELPSDVEWHLMGSYRRNAEVVGDLDILMITESGDLPFVGDLWTPGIPLPPSVDWDRIGPRICQGSLFLAENDYVHIDIWGAKPHQRGAMLQFSTGPMSLNVVLRKRAIRMGMALSQDGLFERETKVQLDDGTEESIFRLLDMDFMTPEQREKWADKKPPSPKPYPPVQRRRPTMSEDTTPTATAEAAEQPTQPPATEPTRPPIIATKRQAPRSNRRKGLTVVPPAATEPDAQPAPDQAAEVTVTEVSDEPNPATDEKLYDVGGIMVTLTEIKQALDLLRGSKSMFVRQPLAAGNHKLHAMDYHGVAGEVFSAHPEMSSLPHKTKTAVLYFMDRIVERAEAGE